MSLRPYAVRGLRAPAAAVRGREAYRPSSRSMQARLRQVPSPVGGWNTRDALDQMDPKDAIRLTNWFPRTSDCITRPGYTLHCDTASGEPVSFLMGLNHEGVAKLLAASDGKLWDVTTSTASSIGTGFASNQWHGVQYKGKLFLANGTDAPQDWDGTTRTATNWTGSGLTKANLIQPFVFKNRLFFVEKNKPAFWYTEAAGNITGALVKFDVAENLAQGGNIKLATKITRDGGEGPDDLLVLVMTTGYAIIYQGTDPADANQWAHVGTFFVGQPANIRGVVEVGSDTVLVTQAGYVPMTTVMPFGRAVRQKDAISDKISEAATDAVSRYGSNAHWSALIHSQSDMLIFNVPRSSTTADQHVMNLSTLAWTKFTGIPSSSWATFSEQPYFGSFDGKIYSFDQGALTDAGSVIDCDAQTAWNYLGDRNSYKNFLMARPIFTGSYLPAVNMASGADFEEVLPGGAITAAQGEAGSEWDTSEWDTATWGGSSRVFREWQSTNAAGYCISLRFSLSISTARLRWNSLTYSYEQGGML